MNAREMEFARVSKLLHDEVGQVLSAVGLQLDVLRMDLTGQVPEIGQRTSEIQKLLEQAVIQIRELSYELNPAIVERAGLAFAIERLAERFRGSFKGSMRVLTDSSVRIPTPAGTALYKIAEHAVENAVQHSGATQIEIIVHPKNGSAKGATLEVRDNGSGFDVDEVRGTSPGLGFILMEYYAQQAGLEFAVKSTRGKGSSVKVSYFG